MFSTILTAIDNSEHADKAVKLACDIAAKYNAKLIFINIIQDDPLDPELLRMAEVEHIVQPPPMPDMARGISTDSSAAQATAVRRAKQVLAERYLQEVESRARENGVDNIVTLSEEGDPAQCIIDAIKLQEADLVILGSRGLSNVKGLLLGSVSHKVCQLASCTCITVK